MARKAKVSGAVPAGFASLNARAPIWKPEKAGATLQGVVMSKREIDAKQAGRQNAKKGEKVRILTLADGDGVLTDVWESHALAGLMDQAKPGDEVFLRFNELVKRGKKRFKDFSVGLKAKGGRK